MFPHLDLVTSPDVSLKDKVTYFSSVNLFHGANIDEKQIKAVKKKILELLNCPISRCDGLLLFEAVLQQSTPFFIEHWQRIIIANLKAPNNICQEVTYRILKLLLRPSNCSSFSANIEICLDAITEQLIVPSNAHCLAAVECLSLCMRRYPSCVSKHLHNIELFLIRQLDTNATHIIEAVADCLVSLPQCWVLANKNKKAWSKEFVCTFKKVLHTLQEILDNLINIDDDEKMSCIDGEESEKPEIFELPDTSDSEFTEIMTLARIFSSLSICAAKFLCRESTVVEVPLLWILNLIERVFRLTDSAKMCESVERNELILLAYPAIQKGAFTILESLIQNFGLVHQTGNIISLLKNAIKASYIATFTGGTNCQMRNLTWRILKLWLKRNGTQISIETGNNKDLLRELFIDITPDIIEEIPQVAPQVSVKRQPQHHQPASSKKKSNPLAVFPGPDVADYYRKNQINTCNEALKVLYEFINTASPFLEEKLKEDIANQIFAVGHKIQESHHPTKKFPFPYINDKCRKNLYKIILALGSSSDFNIRVLQQAFAILRIAEKDTSCKIKLLSRRANSVARHLLQPKKKFPVALTNKKTIYDTPMEEDVGSGWENVAVWNVNHPNQENHAADSQIASSENNANLSPENQNSMEENDIQNNFASEVEYSSTSKFDTSMNSSQTDSDNGSVVEQVVDDENIQESNGIRYANTAHPSDFVKNETPTEVELSSEEENSSAGEEELEDFRVEEEEDEEEVEEEEDLSVNKIAVHTDQNGLASTSEDEENAGVALTKSENGEYSSECSQEETSKEARNDFEHEIETLEEDERPTKKHRLNEEPDETLEEDERPVKKVRLHDETIETLEGDNKLIKLPQLVENSIEAEESSQNLNEDTKADDLNIVQEEIIRNSCHEGEESRTSTPTFDEMCADLVLCESTQLADS